LPQKEEYLLDLNLTDPLLNTNYGKKVPFRQEMAGKVRMVTEERRVVERIFERLKALFW
jgi:hypothetical protein